jgi:hypothetical protein
LPTEHRRLRFIRESAEVTDFPLYRQSASLVKSGLTTKSVDTRFSCQSPITVDSPLTPP